MLQAISIQLLLLLLLPVLVSVVLLFVYKSALAKRLDKPKPLSESSNINAVRQKNFDRAVRTLELDKQDKRLSESEYSYYRDKLHHHYQPLLSSSVGEHAHAAKMNKGMIAFIALLPLLSVLAYWLLVYQPETGKWLQVNQQVDVLSQKLMSGTLDSLSDQEKSKLANSDLSVLDMARVLQAKLTYDVENVDGWVQLGRLYESASEGSLSNLAYQAYEKAYELAPSDDEQVVNFARVNITTGNFPKADDLLDSILLKNAKHESALLMSGFSFFHQQKYQQAINQWQRVLAGRPTNNISEQEQQSRLILEQRIAKAQQAMDALASQWVIAVDIESQGVLPAGAFLFVFAKAEGSPAPVAVQRLATAIFPVSVNLSDANAMMPSRLLSNYEQVTVNAFISLSGNPTDKSGAQSNSVVVKRSAANLPVQLVLNQ